MKVEFFHDVICSFCFPMSARMRKMAERFPELKIVHRSFALGWQERDFIRMFGSRQAVKPEVINHWVNANRNDDEHRFNIEGMKQTDFDFPLSKPALLAAKAAGIIGGEALYWDVFDRIQNKLFVENKNIEEVAVLEEAVKETGVDFAAWKKQFEDASTEQKVLDDMILSEEYGIRSVPTLVINEEIVVHGALPTEELAEILQDLLNKKNGTLSQDEPESCKLEGGEWKCD